MMRPVKSVLLALFMLWFGLQTGWAQVHAVQDSTHALAHSADEASQSPCEPNAADTNCSHTHCSHTANTAPLASDTTASLVPTGQPSGAVHWQALVLPPQIERPKWALTTAAVVSL